MEPLKLSYNWHYKNDSVPINRNMSPQTTVKLCPLQMNSEKLQENWKQILIGQDHVIEAITPYIFADLAGLPILNVRLEYFYY